MDEPQSKTEPLEQAKNALAAVVPAVKEQADKVAESLSEPLAQTKSALADVMPAVKDEAGKIADKSMASGVDAAQAVGKAAESAAQALDEALPALAGYVRNAADYTHKFADELRNKNAEQLLGTAMNWARQQPLLTLAGATVLGFALSRIVKSGVTGTAEAASDTTQSGSTPSSTSYES